MAKGYSIGFMLGIFTFGALYAKEYKQKQAHLSGWYQRSAQKLNEQIKKLDKKAAQKYKAPFKHISACIVPHAALKYSGALAASCFRLVDPKKIKRIVILAPSHRIPFKGIALPNYDSYKVPNGVLAVDKKALKALQKFPLFQVQKNLFKDPHNVEHSLEIELPLIKYYFKDTLIVPLILGYLSEQDRIDTAQRLRAIIDESTLVVVSSDLIHYGARFDYQPFKKHDYLQDHIKQFDGRIIEKIFKASSQDFASFVRQKEATVCGKHPIALLLELLKQKVITGVEPYLVGYATSQDYDNSDPSHSVSYAGIVFAKKHDDYLPALTQYEKTELLKLARTTLERYFSSTKKDALFFPIKTNTLKEPYGAFVTLHDKNKNLCGCIGSITTKDPLYKTIMQRTKSAALQDTRFKPIKKSELSTTHINISVLSKPKAFASYKDIVLGRDGIILKNGFHQSVFLPAVPGEQGWNLKQTLEQLSRKSGLAKNAWKDKNTHFEIFQTIDFWE